MQVATLTERVPVLKVLATQRNFTLLWTGQFVSLLGDGVFRVAMRLSGVTVDRLCPGNGCRLHRIPRPVAALYALWRGCRRPSSQACDHAVVRYGASCGGGGDCSARLAPHPLVLALAHPLAALWPGRQLLSVGVHAVVPHLVDERVLLPPTNSLIQFGNLISRVIGPPLGALFVASGAGVAGAFGLDAFSFVFSAGFLLLLRLPDAASGAWRGIIADI